MGKRVIGRFVAALLLITVFLAVLSLALHAVYPMRYSGVVKSYCEAYGVPVTLALAVIKTESNFKEDAVSSAGACGLMQLMPATFEAIFSELSRDGDIFDPSHNIHAGVRYLWQMHERYGNWRVALAAYNAGPVRVDEWLKDPAYSLDGETLREIPFRETRNYVSRVTAAERIYRRLYPEETQITE